MSLTGCLVFIDSTFTLVQLSYAFDARFDAIVNKFEEKALLSKSDQSKRQPRSFSDSKKSLGVTSLNGSSNSTANQPKRKPVSGVRLSSTKDVSGSDDDEMPGLVEVEAKPRNPIEFKRDDESSIHPYVIPLVPLESNIRESSIVGVYLSMTCSSVFYHFSVPSPGDEFQVDSEKLRRMRLAVGGRKISNISRKVCIVDIQVVLYKCSSFYCFVFFTKQFFRVPALARHLSLHPRPENSWHQNSPRRKA